MLNRWIAITMVALTAATLSACQEKSLTPSELDTVQASSETYRAYERGDCEAVLKLADPERLKVWAFNEMRHSTLLLRGFCLETEGDISGAQKIYRSLVVESPGSFAADDAAERNRILKLAEDDPEYAERAKGSGSREHIGKPGRTPIDRVPVEFPPLAKAVGIGGYAVVEYGVTRHGETEDPIVVDSKPPLLFDGAALRAVRRWQFMRSTSSADTDRQLIRILFKRDGSPDPIVPEDAASGAMTR